MIEGFATPAECDWVMERARPHLHRAHVYNPSGRQHFTKDARTNSSVEFGIAETDIVMMCLRLRIADALRLDRLEVSSILHYPPGQEFKPHYDFLDPVLPGHALDVKKSGQRAATFLIYLNEGYEGGETEFRKLDWRFKGRKGDALLFWNLDPSGAPDYNTMHAGHADDGGREMGLLAMAAAEAKVIEHGGTEKISALRAQPRISVISVPPCLNSQPPDRALVTTISSPSRTG